MPARRHPFPVLFVNLDRATERRAFMDEQGRRLGLGLERFPALTPADASAEDAALARTWERPMTPPELAAFLSHRALWRRAARSEAGLVILEDDAVLSDAFPAALEADLGLYDLCNFETADRRKFFRRVAPVELGAVRLAPVARDKSGAAAYFLSPRGAERLLVRAERRAAPADAFLFASGLDMAQVEPAPAAQAHVLRRMGIDPGIDLPTQIHEPRARLPVTRANVGFHLRRVATQVALARLHFGRLRTLDFRHPEVRLADFPYPALPDAHSSS